ncbi:hypothetical protein Tco_1153985 [Tanacetum coccineum]
MQDAIEFATELMDQKIRTFGDRQAENKRKIDGNSRNNQNQQQPFKRQNVARAYTTRPVCSQVKNCKKVGHLAHDCRSLAATANNQRAPNIDLMLKEELYAKISKCKSWIPKVQFLNHVIDSQGLADYYRRFIEGFSKITKLMTKLTQKKVKFDWGEKQEVAFQLLKKMLYSAPIMALPEGAENFIVTDIAQKDKKIKQNEQNQARE